ncbi:MAG: chorismate-binding protein, partial [Bacteroidota bacterium]
MCIDNNRNKKAFPFQSHELEVMKLKMLNWLQPFSIFSYLCTNQNYTTKGTYEIIIGVATDDTKLYNIEDIANEAQQDWFFGHIAYNYKSFVEKQLENTLPVFNTFSPTLFYRPTSVIYIERNSQSLVIESDQDPILIYNQVMSAQSIVEPIQETLDFVTSESQADYITKIKRIQEHIRMGDCYELNYCVVVQSKLQQTAALQVFASLMQHSPAPFAAYYKFKHQHVLCASPERFLAKTDQMLYS